MSILKIKDSQGNWVGVPSIKGDTGNGISSAVLNNDYTLTLTFTDGTTYKTPSIRGEKGEKGEPATDMEIHICSASEYDSETRIPTIANPNDKTFYLVPTEDGTSPDLFTEWVYVNNAWEMFGSAKIDLSGYLTDVQVNGTSIVSDGVANVPIANDDTFGTVKVATGGYYGINYYGNDVKFKFLKISYAQHGNDIKNGMLAYKPITPTNQHESTFYGLAKAAGADEKDSTLPVGQYTDNAKDSIQNMLGITPLIASHETDPFESNHVVGELFIINSKLYRAKTALTAGEYINEGTNVEVVSVAGVLDSKVDDVQINGTSVINNGVAEIPVSSVTTLGVLKPDNGSLGINANNAGQLIIRDRPLAYYKGANPNTAVICSSQHIATFYGLTKAAGVDMSSSSNPVGTYTPEAKSAIKQMLSIADNYDSFIVDVEGTDPTITGQPSYRYNCGEVLSLTVTPPETGTIDFRFTSGSSPTVLTLPSTVKMPEWWVEVEANTIYEMCITDGVYCGVMSWAM